MFTALGVGLLGMLALSATPPDISGDWSGDGWSRVVLNKTSDTEYSGSYTAAGRQRGEIRLQWSLAERRFNGRWREGDERFGDISLRQVGGEIRGALGTDPDSKIDPAAPRLTDFTWTPVAAAVRDDRGRSLSLAAPPDRALQFDGMGYVSIPGDNFRNLQSGTISVWIRPTGDGAVISSLHDGSSDRQFPYCIEDKGDGTFALSMAGVTKDDRFVLSLEADDHFSLNAWHHLAISSLHGSGTFHVYVDGKPQHMHVHDAWSGEITDFFFADTLRSSDDLQLGAKSDSHNVHFSDGHGFHGAMRDLLIFDQAFSPEQVAAIAAAGRGGDLAHYAWMRSLVAGYHMDESRGTTVRDFSGKGNDGTLHGGATWGTGAIAAPHARAMQFDGTRYVTLPQTTKFTARDFTVSLWFEPVKADAFQFLFMRGFSYRDRQGDIGLKINRSSGELDFQVRTADSQWLFGWDAPESRLRSPFKLKEWNHVVVTRRGDTYAMWMNGAKVGSERSSADISDTDDANPFIVGGIMEDGGVVDKFQGALDGLRIFHRCLSDAEIAALYNSGGGGESILGRTALPPAPAADAPTALQFDGTGYVSIPGDNFRNLQSGTVSVWIRPAAGGYLLSSLTDMSNNRQGGVSLDDNGDGTFSIGVGEVNKDSRYVFSVRADNRFSQNAWHHVVYTSQHGSGTCRLYVDGKLQNMHFWQAGNAVDFFFADLMQSGDDLQLGATSDDHHVHCGFFKGAMRDLLIFDRAFSSQQVAAIHAAGPGDLPQFARMSSLVAGYRLDEGRGTTVRDFSGHGNDGTLHGGLTWGQGTAAGLHPHAVHFDQKHYAVVPPSTKFTAGDFTISLWLKPASSGRRGPAQSQIVVARNFGYRDQRGDMVLAIHRLSGQLDFTAYGNMDNRSALGGRDAPADEDRFSDDRGNRSDWIFGWDASERFRSPVNYDRWNHVAVTRRGDTYAMWMNGVRACTERSSADISDVDNTNPFKMGSGNGAPPYNLDQMYKGDADDFRIFRRCLSDQELAELYRSGGDEAFLHGEGRVKVGPLHADYSQQEPPGAEKPVQEVTTPNALHFDGRAESRVVVPNLDLDRLTFATWVKRDAIGRKQYLIMPASNGGWGVFFSELPDPSQQRGSNNYVWFTHKGAGGWHSDAEITDTQWHFVAVTLDRHSLNFYIDGKPAGRAPMPYTIDSGGSGYCLGGTLDDPGAVLTGSLAGTLIFDRPLGPAEIAAWYEQGRGAAGAGKTTGLVAGYRFDEGRGTTVRDFSGHGNDGTLHGGATWVSGRALAAGAAAPTPGIPNALHFDHGHVDLGGKQLTTGATSISFWYHYDGYTDQMALPLDLKIGPLEGAFVAINHSGDPGDGRQTVSYNNRGGGRCSFETAPYLPTDWTHVVLTYNGGDPADAANYRAYVNGRSTALTTLGGDGGHTISNSLGFDSFGSTIRTGLGVEFGNRVGKIRERENPFNVTGESTGSLNNFFIGSLSDVLIYNTVLSAGDVEVLYGGSQRTPDGPPRYPRTGNLVAGYRCDEGRGSTIADFSGHGNDGTLHDFNNFGAVGTLGNAVTWVPGRATPLEMPAAKPAAALQFDGSGYVTIPGKSFRNLQSGTVSAWIRPAAGGGTIFSSLHDMSSDRQFPLYIGDHEDGTFSVALTAVSKDGRFLLQLDSDDRFPLDTWHHVVYSSLHGSGTFHLYVDGRPRHMYVHESWSQPTADFFFADVLRDSDDLQLGGKSDSHNAHFSSGHGFHGAMRDLLIFDEPFSPEQATALFAAGRPHVPMVGDLAQYPWMRSLVAGYHLDEGQGTTLVDFSGHGNDGTLHGGATWGGGGAAAADAPGTVPAHALRLDGRSGYIDIGPTADEDLNMGGSSLTMAVWVKPLQPYDGEQILVEHGVGLSDQSNYLYQMTTIGSNTLRFNFPAMQGNNWGWLDAAVNLADGNWHFVAATFDSRLHLAKLYDNGVLLKSKRTMESIAADETPKHTYVGCRGYGACHFNGDIGELLIYNRAVSAAQVAKLCAEAGGSCDSQDKVGLVAGYYFDEGQGTTVRDFTGHGNTGTLHGGVNWVRGKPAPAGAPAADASTALEFGETGYVAIPGASFRKLQSGTLAVWIRPEAGEGDPHKGGVVLSSLHDMSNDRQFYPSVLDKGDGTFSVVVVGVSRNDQFKTCMETDNRFPLDAWHHLIYTSAERSGRFDLYIDGKPQHMHVLNFGGDTDFFYADAMRDGDDLQIGAKSDSHAAHSGFFHGAMRDLMIFEQALSPDQVAALDAAGARRVRMVGGDLAQNPWMSGLVAGYHMDEGRGTTLVDFSGHGNDGTLHGGVTWGTGRGPAGPHAGALQFDGTRYATLPQSTKFTAGDFTVSLWFQPTKAGDWQFLFMRGFSYRDQQGDIGLKINRDSGELDFQARTSDGQWLFGWDVPESRLRSPFKLRQWNHVVVTRRGDTFTMWMNGAKAGSEVSPADISDRDDASPFIVGGMMTDSGVVDKFQGGLDEFRIFHRCLSDKEIAALYDGGGTALPPREDRFPFDGRNLLPDRGGGTSLAGGVQTPEAVPPAAGISHALHFDGRQESYVEIPNLDMERLTFATWVKRDVTAKRQFMIKSARGGGWGVYFSESPETANALPWIKRQSERRNHLWFTQHDVAGWESDAEIADTQWHFVAVTLDGDALRFYIDGKPAGGATRTVKRAMDSQGASYCLGGTPNDLDCSLQGCLQDTLVFNRPLAAAEIAQLFSRGRGAADAGRMAGLVAGYHLDEGRGATVADFSGHGNDGTLHGGVVWISAAAAPHAGALQFDGTRYATLPQSTKFTAGDFTVSLWFNPAKVNDWQALFMRGFVNRDQQGDIGLKLDHEDGNLYLQLRTSGGEWLFGWPQTRIYGRSAFNQWNHVVVTRRGDTFTMWMNGVRVASERSSADISDTDNSNPFIVGGFRKDSGNDIGVVDKFQGALDEFRIFHRCLSDKEIAALYDGGGGTALPPREDRSPFGGRNLLPDGGGGTSLAGSAVEIANSVNDFSGTQGLKNWYYGYYSGKLEPSTFKPFPMYDPDYANNQGGGNSMFGGTGGWGLKWGVGGYWAALWANGGHPNSDDGNGGRLPVTIWPARRWKSDIDGTITISGMLSAYGGGKMFAGIFVDDRRVFWEQATFPGKDYSLSVTVSIGSHVDFVIAPNGSDVVSGATMFTGVISVPSAGTAGKGSATNANWTTGANRAAAGTALHLDHGHVDLGGKQLTTGATSVSVWYHYDGHTDEFPILLDLKAGSLSALFVSLNTTVALDAEKRSVPTKKGSRRNPPAANRSANPRGQTVTFANRGGDGRVNAFRTTPFRPAAWNHLVCTYDGADPYDVRSYAIYVNGRALGLSPAVYSNGAPFGGDTKQNNLGYDSYSFAAGSTPKFFIGSLSELLVYDTVLSAGDVEVLYGGKQRMPGDSYPRRGNLVAGYHLDEGRGTTVYDFTHNGNDGLLQSGATWAPGRVGSVPQPRSALRLGVDRSYVTVPDSKSLDALGTNGSGLGFSAWVNWDGIFTGNFDNRGSPEICMKQPATAFSYGFGLNSYNGNPGAVGLNMNRAGFGRVGYAARTPLTPHVWHHVAATYDRTANEVRFYLDGALDGTFAGVTGDVVPDSHPLWIGNNSSNERFNGSIAELCLFGRTLSAADISAFYNSGRGLYGDVAPSVYRGLTAGYHFSEGRGTKVADFSGNGNDGQLMDGETWGRVGAALQKTPPADASATLHFDERRGTTVHDFSGNGKDGTLHGGVEWASDNGDRDRKDKQTTLTDLSRQFSVASRHPQKGG